MSEVTHFQAEIKAILAQVRSKVRSATNSAVVEVYWLNGPNTSSFCSPKKN